MDRIIKISKKHKIHLIEDYAHAIESTYRNKHTGTFGTFGCFSFYATKNLSIGEGGMLITDDKKLYQKARILSLHGMDKAAWNRYGKNGYRHYDVSEIGYKYNLMDLLSSIGIQQLKQININHKIREKVWKQYDKSFKKSNFRIPSKYDKSIYKHAYHLYNIFLNKAK